MSVDFLVDIAGIAGFVLSVILAVWGFIQSRENYQITVIDYADFGPSTRFLISITNLSANPLIITQFRFCGTTCELEPKKIRGEPETWNGVTTPQFPICVPARGAAFAYIEFVDCPSAPLVPDMLVTFQIQTTARLGLKTVLLPNKSHYLNRR